MKQLASERGLNDAAIDSIRFESINAAVGIHLASERNEEAISTIQSELIRQKYGEGTAIAAQLLQIAASGSLARNAKVGGEKGSSLPTLNATLASNGLTYKSNPKHTLGQPGN